MVGANVGGNERPITPRKYGVAATNGGKLSSRSDAGGPISRHAYCIEGCASRNVPRVADGDAATSFMTRRMEEKKPQFIAEAHVRDATEVGRADGEPRSRESVVAE